MVKEIKFLLYITVITLFFFFTIKYYLSDQFKKKVYRTHNNYELIICGKGDRKKELESKLINQNKEIIHFLFIHGPHGPKFAAWTGTGPGKPQILGPGPGAHGPTGL